ncbi:ankyrin repeat-containing domain protein [Phialemonium atrogriseum]|uniref:Ankyrin repeat-containing domain protein n=1 Tax=Phialemonium atrogriseum TaxID=1093897 RepID=A0AAJ0FJ61_9PEZI|nr:ankyrin repeat-containing domain protein [Phialemonium atrogriseum]KAK1769572.1 ankyrin repeat-containing domain protein [Phialemonium atrogriseum]
MVLKDVLSNLKSIIYQIICRHRSLVRHVKTVYEVQGRALSRSFSSLWNIFERITSDPKSDDFSVDIFSLENSPVESLAESSKDERFLDGETCQTITGRYRFFSYSALHWAEHYAAAQDLATPELRKAGMTFLDPGSAHCTNWLRFYRFESSMEHDEPPPDFDAVTLAAYFDIHHIVAELLDTNNSYPQSGKNHALFWASKMGRSKSIEVLLRAGAEPNHQIVDRQTALTVAAQGDYLDAVALLLLDETTDINLRGKAGRTALSFACGNGHLDLIATLLKRDDCEPDEPDSSVLTPLFWPVGGGHISTISTLLQHPARDGLVRPLEHLLRSTCIDPNLADKNGQSPLSWAAGNGHDGTVRALLRGSRVDKASLDNDSRGADFRACEGGHEAVLSTLNNFPGMIDVLLSTGSINVDKRDCGGRTALYWAVEYGHLDMVKALIGKGADVRSTSNGRSTPISVARAFGRDDMVSFL